MDWLLKFKILISISLSEMFSMIVENLQKIIFSLIVLILSGTEINESLCFMSPLLII